MSSYLVILLLMAVDISEQFSDQRYEKKYLNSTGKFKEKSPFLTQRARKRKAQYGRRVCCFSFDTFLKSIIITKAYLTIKFRKELNYACQERKCRMERKFKRGKG